MFIKRWVSDDKGAPPDNIMRIFPPSSFRTFLKIILYSFYLPSATSVLNVLYITLTECTQTNMESEEYKIFKKKIIQFRPVVFQNAIKFKKKQYTVQCLTCPRKLTSMATSIIVTQMQQLSSYFEHTILQNCSVKYVYTIWTRHNLSCDGCDVIDITYKQLKPLYCT